MQTHLRGPSPSWGKVHHVANLMGILSSKEGSPLVERTSRVLGPSASKSSWCYPLIFLPRSLHWEEENTVKKEHCVPRTIHFGKEEPGPMLCLPPHENGSHQERARAALPSLLPSLGQFQGLLQGPAPGSQGRKERPLERGPRHILGIQSFSQRAGGGGRGLCVDRDP